VDCRVALTLTSSVLSSSSLWVCLASPSSYYSIFGQVKIKSAGSTTSDPYTRKKGEYPVALLTSVRS
jgi:hypothetical protein